MDKTSLGEAVLPRPAYLKRLKLKPFQPPETTPPAATRLNKLYVPRFSTSSPTRFALQNYDLAGIERCQGAEVDWTLWDRRAHGCAIRAYMDVFTASPEKQSQVRHPLFKSATMDSSEGRCESATGNA
ncbi:MAG: hypothetical protein V2I26_04575, partial [Halieaceae bacterium]|nr:hypothetical protein [Halieaceae bacterium]